MIVSQPEKSDQPDLFDDAPPPVALPSDQMADLEVLLETLLTEIAAALASGESDDE